MTFNSTFAIIKPHILENGIEDEIIVSILSRKFVIRRLETRYLTVEEVQSLYEEHKDKYFYEGLCQRMLQGPVIIMELTRNPTGNGKECWEQWRECIGATDPSVADYYSIRHLYGQSQQYNAVHGSDSEESAKRELNVFFNFLQVEN